jgi:hypothetical protein
VAGAKATEPPFEQCDLCLMFSLSRSLEVLMLGFYECVNFSAVEEAAKRQYKIYVHHKNTENKFFNLFLIFFFPWLSTDERERKTSGEMKRRTLLRQK